MTARHGLREAPSPASPLRGIDLAIFDKDGTLIDFHLMWRGWVDALADRLTEALGAAALPSGGDLNAQLEEVMGVDPTGRIRPHGLLAATPMARIRDRVEDVLLAGGVSPKAASVALAAAWHAPDPVALAHPLADLPRLFTALADAGCRVAIATSDDREPTERTLEALGVAGIVAGLACADDGLPVKPAPDAVLRLCVELGVAPARTAMIGDSPADLAMGRAAGAGLVVGVLTGVARHEDLAPLADIVLDSIAALEPARHPEATHTGTQPSRPGD